MYRKPQRKYNITSYFYLNNLKDKKTTDATVTFSNITAKLKSLVVTYLSQHHYRTLYYT